MTRERARRDFPDRDDVTMHALRAAGVSQRSVSAAPFLSHRRLDRYRVWVAPAWAASVVCSRRENVSEST